MTGYPEAPDSTHDDVVSQVGPWAMIPVWVLSLGLSGGELATYVALRSFADRGGQAHPKVKTISERAGVTERTVERALAKFRALDIVASRQIVGPDGSVIGNRYHVRDVPPLPVPVSPPPDGDDATPPDGDVATPPTGMSGQEEHTKEHTSTPPQTSSVDPPRRQAAPRGSRLPADFEPTDEMIEWARTECPATTRADHDQFKDYWLSASGAKATKLDWNRAWKVWMRTEQSRRSGRQRGHQSERAALYEAWDRQVAELTAKGF